MPDPGGWLDFCWSICPLIVLPCVPLALYCLLQAGRWARAGAMGVGAVGGVGLIVLLEVLFRNVVHRPWDGMAARILAALAGIAGAHMGVAVHELFSRNEDRRLGARWGASAGGFVGLLGALAVCIGWAVRLRRLPFEVEHLTAYAVILLGTASLGALIGAPIRLRVEEEEPGRVPAEPTAPAA